jgi:hypothetical protein
MIAPAGTLVRKRNVSASVIAPQASHSLLA